ncbi:MAG: SUF system NifU family Fe-S cluster assembly protein [Alphaproteobacteria bacterium]|nr:MAG: SUF system NifU family Fe-S cluster assembly protein [Alphaproteobacteria bacterium]
MSELRDLYQEVILDHSRSPRNFGHHQPSNRQAKGNNPLCGDKFTVYVLVEDGIVKDLSFEGRGCAISTASASLMTELLKGRTEDDAQAMFERFHAVVTGEKGEELDDGLDKLNVLAGVRGYPMRVKCATLAWHTLKAALKQTDETVVTE